MDCHSRMGRMCGCCKRRLKEQDNITAKKRKTGPKPYINRLASVVKEAKIRLSLRPGPDLRSNRIVMIDDNVHC